MRNQLRQENQIYYTESVFITEACDFRTEWIPPRPHPAGQGRERKQGLEASTLIADLLQGG